MFGEGITENGTATIGFRDVVDLSVTYVIQEDQISKMVRYDKNGEYLEQTYKSMATGQTAPRTQAELKAVWDSIRICRPLSRPTEARENSKVNV